MKGVPLSNPKPASQTNNLPFVDTLGPQNLEKGRFWIPNIWAITPQNEGNVGSQGSWWLSHPFHIHRTQMTSIFEGQYPKIRPFSTKTRVIWVLGIYRMVSGIFFLLSFVQIRDMHDHSETTYTHFEKTSHNISKKKHRIKKQCLEFTQPAFQHFFSPKSLTVI